VTHQSHESELLIVGAGVGGVAAALAALRRGRTVTMTEEYRWIGGQLTVQGTPPDEHPWIEDFGATASYREFRNRVRRYYVENYALTDRARRDPLFNPGNATVSKLAGEPRVFKAVLDEMLAPWIASGKLRLLTSVRLIGCATDGDSVREAEFEDLESGDRFIVSAHYVIDATELGDVLEAAGVEHVTGTESRAETGEPSAPETADPMNMQSFSWPFAVEYDPEGDHTIDRPSEYARLLTFRPPFWPGNYLSFTYPEPRTLAPVNAEFEPHSDGPDDLLVADQSKDPGSSNLWVYRRILWRHNFADGSQPRDVSLVNWPMSDYLDGPLFGGTADDTARQRAGARQLSLSYLYWLQTEAPRPDGGTGWKGLRLRPDVMGTDDGLSIGPYVRESRRIRALRTVVEQDISLAARGPGGAVRYDDTVGIGAYRIDLHPSTGGDNYIDVACNPFHIPLSALVPQRVTNLLPAAKNIGTTHITNGCYRVHPAEWNIGESAGALASFCLAKGTTPHATAASAALIAEFQQDLLRDGVPLAWPEEARGY
jgi:hypothetical protein